MSDGGSDNTVNYGNVIMTPEEATAHAQETMDTEDHDNLPWWMDETYNLARRVKRARAKALATLACSGMMSPGQSGRP